MRHLLPALSVLILAGCASAPPPPAAEAPSAPVASGASGEPKVDVAPPPPLHFIEDDLATATARAKAEGKVLFVDVWAPWCHTCLSMKEFVLDDPALRSFGERVVFASIDSDKDSSAAFLEKHEVKSWPTFFLIEPSSDKVLGYWSGSASVREMRAFLEEGVEEMAGGAADPASRAFAEARRAHAAGDLEKARADYEKALAAAAADWPNRSAAELGMIQALAGAKKWKECAAFGEAALGSIQGSSKQGDAAAYLLHCASQLPKGEERSRVVAVAVDKLRATVKNPPQDASIDDRADMLATLADALEETGDKEGAKKAHEERLALMEKAAAGAKSKEEAQVFDYGRANSYVALGRADEAIKMLTEREKELPNAYEPSARLASVYFKVGKYNEALEAVNRTLAKAYGPRKLLYMKLKADILDKLGDQKGRLEVLREEVAGYEALPPGQASPERLGAARKRLEEAEKKRKK